MAFLSHYEGYFCMCSFQRHVRRIKKLESPRAHFNSTSIKHMTLLLYLMTSCYCTDHWDKAQNTGWRHIFMSYNIFSETPPKKDSSALGRLFICIHGEALQVPGNKKFPLRNRLSTGLPDCQCVASVKRSKSDECEWSGQGEQDAQHKMITAKWLCCE